MKYYAIVGKNEQIVDECKVSAFPQGYIEMSEERPTPEHVAADDGTWILVDQNLTSDNAEEKASQKIEN